MPRLTPNKLVRPFLKWAGGKRQLLPELIRHMPDTYNKYYEPFIGGGALLFALQPKKAVISDSNQELISCYTVIRDSLDELVENLRHHRNEEDYFYRIREWDRQDSFSTKTPVQKAARIIFLNKTCYNGLFRVNAQGQFNAPFGRYTNPNILDEAVLKAVSSYLNTAKVDLLNQDFAKTVAKARKNDFIYFDPPYDPVSDTASFTGYDINGFNKDEQKRLRDTFVKLSDKGCKVMLSNAYTNFIRDLYQDYTCIRVKATRAINSKASRRGKIDEILVKNYEGNG
ncbi:DNA adenine methylase [Leptothoe sp. PORK10 BA2]|uniref:DNA adenine methylase n=1 Tax=Leptothoe sp. PORK10 BA2 TaxID=3110254 RepID=UPI002B211B54|nr:DNA adenine methylase [Leptothoe sp. PORK10 BA2]